MAAASRCSFSCLRFRAFHTAAHAAASDASSSPSTGLIGIAGAPAATTLGGTSRVTTLPAPITE